MKKIILLRHGQSQWNLENRFTGWTDVDLSDKGREEAREAGRLIREAGLEPRYYFTSYLKRAIHTLQLAAAEMDREWVPVIKDWHLNERHYGALQGLNKADTAEKYGEEQVHSWRRSFDVMPPLLTPDDPRFPGNDPRWDEVIVPKLALYDTVLIAAHGNSLRALAMLLLHMTATEVVDLEIPTGKPWVFTLDDRMQVIENAYL